MKLYNGDCLEIMKDIPSKSIDLILTDPPYGTTACKWDSVIPFDKMWEQLERIIKDNGAIVLFGSEPFTSYLRMSNIKHYKYDWIWDKTFGLQPMLANIQPMKRHEEIMVFSKNGKKINYYPLREKLLKPRISTGAGNATSSNSHNIHLKRQEKHLIEYDTPTTVLQYKPVTNGKNVHPTQKPTDLLEYLIKTYSKENETVLDFTMGSGSTGVACINTNRDFIGIELDKNYFEIAEKRIAEAEKEKECSLF